MNKNCRMHDYKINGAECAGLGSVSVFEKEVKDIVEARGRTQKSSILNTPSTLYISLSDA